MRESANCGLKRRDALLAYELRRSLRSSREAVTQNTSSHDIDGWWVSREPGRFAALSLAYSGPGAQESIDWGEPARVFVNLGVERGFLCSRRSPQSIILQRERSES